MCRCFSTGRTGFPGLTSAMARGIRTACAAGGLNNPETIAAVASNRFSQGCFNVELVRLGGPKQFCSERDIFAYLVSQYCSPKPDAVLPSAMGSLQYPPASWIEIATIIAGVGAVLIVWAWFLPSCSKDLDGCAAAQMHGQLHAQCPRAFAEGTGLLAR
jgi:hypothetical protein